MDQSGLLFSNEALLLDKQSLKGGQMLAKLTIGGFLSFQEDRGGVAVFRGLLDAANHVLMRLGQLSAVFGRFTAKGADSTIRFFGHD